MKLFSLVPLLALTLLIVVTSAFLSKTKSVAPTKSNAATYGVTIEYNIAFGTHPKQKLDLCKPKNITGKLPAVILIHGGGGDKSDFTSICKNLAEKGFVSAAVNFREVPPPAYKVILPDISLALSWLKSRDYVEASKIGSWGGSLGGYVSSLLGTREGTDKVQCVNNNYGPTDFTDPSEWQGSPLADEFVAKFFGGVTYDENPQLYRDLSPITHVSSNDAGKWLFTRSTNDPLVPRTQMTKMIEALKALGLQTEFYEYKGTGSGHANKLGPLQGAKLLQKRFNFMTGCLNDL